ncbi:hypothetical protein niasHT_006958 [Heterodera trifolii]|uniref:Uncharacterized protein n=1 Tax=Heterodera trifolii TaxID=157864 RepID=A0ABD2LMQ6_9BILA
MSSENKAMGAIEAKPVPPSASPLVQHLLNADPFLADLVSGLPVSFAGIPYAKETERQQNFIHSAQTAKRIHILHFASEFLFNGASVRLRGHISTRTLHGKVQVELAPQSLIVQRQQSERFGERIAQLRTAALRL